MLKQHCLKLLLLTHTVQAVVQLVQRLFLSVLRCKSSITLMWLALFLGVVLSEFSSSSVLFLRFVSLNLCAALFLISWAVDFSLSSFSCCCSSQSTSWPWILVRARYISSYSTSTPRALLSSFSLFLKSWYNWSNRSLSNFYSTPLQMFGDFRPRYTSLSWTWSILIGLFNQYFSEKHSFVFPFPNKKFLFCHRYEES